MRPAIFLIVSLLPALAAAQPAGGTFTKVGDDWYGTLTSDLPGDSMITLVKHAANPFARDLFRMDVITVAEGETVGIVIKPGSPPAGVENPQVNTGGTITSVTVWVPDSFDYPFTVYWSAGNTGFSWWWYSDGAGVPPL